jgi:predicted HTH transcriptional regulator
MTNREFLSAIASSTNLDAALVEHATDALAKLDAANAARKSKPSKRATENAPLLEQIVADILTADGEVTATEVAETLGVSVQKASSLLRQLVAENRAAQSETKQPKKGKVKTYTLIGE